MKKLAKSTKWLIGVLLALVMLLAGFGIVSAVNSGSESDDLSASGATVNGGAIRCYIFLNGKEQKLSSTVTLTTNWDQNAADTAWTWETFVSPSGAYAKDGILHSFNSLNLSPTGSYVRNYNNITDYTVIVYTLKVGARIYTRSFTHHQGYGELLNFDDGDCTNLTAIPSSVASWFTTSSHGTVPYTGQNYLPSDASTYFDLKITWIYSGATVNVNDVKAAGTYIINATPKAGYKFPDGTTDAKTTMIKIDPLTVDVTVTDGQTLTYNGKAQKGYTLGGADAGKSSLYSITGVSATEAGSYTTTLTLANSVSMSWKEPDKTTVNWKIEKAEQSFTFDTTNIETKGENVILSEDSPTVEVPLKMTGSSGVWNMTNPTVDIGNSGVVSAAKVVPKGDGYVLQLTRGETLGTADIKVTLHSDKNISNEAVETLKVKNTVRNGFYISEGLDTSGEPNIIYKTLEDALLAAQSKGESGALSITARGDVTISPVDSSLWTELVLKGEKGCKVTAVNSSTVNKSVFEVGMGKKLTLGEGLTFLGGGTDNLSLVNLHEGGALTLGKTESATSDVPAVAIQGFASSAVKVDGGTLTAGSGVSFIGNAATNGGAIYATGGTISLADVTFTDNTASEKGGAIYATGGTISLADVTFTDNTASEKGGAIYISGAKTTVTATHSDESEGLSFENNTAENGGAIYIGGGKFEISEEGGPAAITMDGNTAKGESACGGAIYVAKGGALDAEKGTLNITSGSAEGKGGAIYVAKESTVTLGEGATVVNNKAAHGNGVYIADGATATASTAASVTDGYMLGHDESDSGNIASLKLSGEKPTDGKTIVVEFENPAEQLDQVDEAGNVTKSNQYVTGVEEGKFTSQELKSFMRVKNAGYTFDPADDGEGNSLGLIKSDTLVAVIFPKDEDGDDDFNKEPTTFTSFDALLAYLEESSLKNVNVYLPQYVNKNNSSLNSSEIILPETLAIPEGLNITFDSIVRHVASDGTTVTYKQPETPTTIKRDSALLGEMINVAKGGSLTLKNVTLDGGAVWGDEGTEAIAIKDEDGKAGSVKTNNTAVTAHAPVIVNNGELTLGDKSTIQNNDNNWATPGEGFGSENYGGGVRNQGAGVLNMETGSTIRDCYSREGGAIMNVNKESKKNTTDGKNPDYVAPADNDGVGPQVNLKGGNITGCVSQNKGAAVQSIYGEATVNLGGKDADGNETGANIEGCWSLNDLGVLSVEEGANLNVSAGTVKTTETKPLDGSAGAKNKNAIYLYNQYSKADYEKAPENAKPYIEGNHAGKLTVTGSPSIDGSVHLDDPCYVVGADGKATDDLYPTYVDVTGFEKNSFSGSGDTLQVSVSADAENGKLTRPAGQVAVAKDETGEGGVTAEAALKKVEVSPKTAISDGNTSGTFETNYKVDGTTVKGVGSYDLKIEQTEKNALTITGAVDADCKEVTFTVGEGEDAKEYPAELKDGKFSVTIPMDETSGKASLEFGYGDSKVTLEDQLTLNAVVIDEDGNLLLPSGWKYQADGETKVYKDWSAESEGLPQDIVIDENGYATFKADGAEGAEISVKIGKRAETPDPKQAPLYDLGGNSLTVEIDEEERAQKLEYALLDSNGKIVLGTDGKQVWATPDENGRIAFKNMNWRDSTKPYTVVARRPAGDNTLASEWVKCPDSTYSTLTDGTGGQAEKKTAFEAFFTGDELNADSNLDAVLTAYEALKTTLGTDREAILNIPAIAQKKAALDKAFADAWCKEYEDDLKQAVEWVQSSDVFGKKGSELSDEDEGAYNAVETLKGTIAAAYKALVGEKVGDTRTGGLTEEAQTLVREKLLADGTATNGVHYTLDPVTNYCEIVVKQMQKKAEEFINKQEDGSDIYDDTEKETLRELTGSILAEANKLGEDKENGIKKAKTLYDKLDDVLTESGELLAAYNNALESVTGEDARATRQKAILKEVLDEYSAKLAEEAAGNAGDLSNIVSAAKAAFGRVEQRMQAEDAYLEAYAALTHDERGTQIFDNNGNVDTAVDDEQTLAWRELAKAAFKSFGDIVPAEGSDEITNEQINAAVQKAVKELLYSFVDTTTAEDGTVNITESAEVAGIITDAIGAVAGDVASADNSKVVDFSADTITKLESVQKDLAFQRLRDQAKREFLDSYNAVKNKTLTWDGKDVKGDTADEVREVFTALQDETITDAAELNTALKEAVNALLDSLEVKTTDSAAATGIVEDAKTAVEQASAADGVADISKIVEGVKQKVDLQLKYEELLKKAGLRDEALIAQLDKVLDGAIGAIDDVEKDLPTTAEQLTAAQTNGENALTLAAHVAAAKQEYLDSYNALKGRYADPVTSANADSFPEVAEAFAAIDRASEGGADLENIAETLKDQVSALLTAMLNENSGAENVQDIITETRDGKEGTVGVKGATATDSELVPNVSEIVDGVYEKVELQKKYDELSSRLDPADYSNDRVLGGVLDTAKAAVDSVGTEGAPATNQQALKEGLTAIEASAALSIAQKEFLDSYNALKGTNVTWSTATSYPAEGDAKAVADVFAELKAEAEKTEGAQGTLQQRLNGILKERVEELLEGLVTDGDSNKVKAVADAAKENVNAATSVKDTIAEVSDLVKEVKSAVETQRFNERKDAKETYKELYKALKEKDADESDQIVKDALEAIDKTTIITETNKALADALGELLKTIPFKDAAGDVLDSTAVPTIVNRGVASLAELAETVSGKNEALSAAKNKVKLADLIEKTKQDVKARREKDIADIQEAYIEAYETLTGEKVTSHEDEKVKDALDYIAEGDSCREALRRLIYEMEDLREEIKREGDSAILTGYIDTVMDSFIKSLKTLADLDGDGTNRKIPTMKEKFTVNGNSNYTLQYFKSVIDAQRGAEKDVTVEAYKALYEKIMGKPMDEEDEEVQKALAAILIGETNGKTQEALEAEVLKLLDGLLQKDENGKTLDSKKEIDAVEAAKKAVKDIIEGAIEEGAIPSLDDMLKAVEGIKEKVETERAASIKAAGDAFEEVYASFTGEEADPETDAVLKEALGNIAAAKSFSEAHKTLNEEIEKLLEGLLQKDEEGTALDSENVQNIVKNAESTVKGVVDSALSSKTAPTETQVDRMKNAVKGIAEKVEAARAQDIKDAQEAYKNAYKAFMGETVADPADGIAKDALDNIGSAKNCAEANGKLAEEVKKLAESALKGTDDSKAVKDYIKDVQKAVEEFVEEANDPANGGRNRRIPSFFMAELAVNGEKVSPEETKQAVEDLREEEKDAAKEAFKDFYKEVTGKDADENDPAVKKALDALGKTDGITDLNDTLAEKTQELFDDLFTTDGKGNVTDSDESKQLVEEAKEALKEKFAEEAKAGKTPTAEDVKKAVDELRAELEKQREEETKASEEALDGLSKGEEGKKLPEDLQKQIDEYVEAAKKAIKGKDYETQKFIEEKVLKQREVLDELAALREAVESDGFGDEIMEEIEKNAKAALDSIEKAETAKEVESAAARGASQTRKPYADAVQEKIDAAIDALKEEVKDDSSSVRRVVTGKGGYRERLKNAASAKEVEELLKEGKAAIEGERFLGKTENNAAAKDFSKVTDADKDVLESAKKAYDDLAPEVKKYLDETSGYTDGFAGLIADRVEKAKFEAEKKAKAEEAKQFLRDCDGYSVKQANAAAIEDLKDVQYEPHTDGSTRSAHVEAAKEALQNAYEDVGKETAHAQSLQRFENSAKEEAENRKYSGRYSDEGKQSLDDAVKEYVEKAKEIPSAGKDGKTAQELVDGLYEEFLGSLEEVPVRRVTSEELASSAPEYGAEDKGELWGTVTGNELAGGSSFAGSFKEDDGSYQSAVKKGKPVAGAGLGERDPEKSLSGKEVKSVFDVNLTKDGKEVGTEGEVEVRVLLPEELRRERGLQVVVVDEAGNVHVLGTRVDGDYLVFSADTLGEFVVLGEKVINLWWLIILLIVAIAAEGGVIAFFLVKKNRAAAVAPIALLTIFIPAPAVVVCIVLSAVLLAETAGLVFVIVKKQKHGDTQPQETQPQEEKTEE